LLPSGAAERALVIMGPIAIGLLAIAAAAPGPASAEGLAVTNGWLTHDGMAVWGWVQHNGWWRAGQRPNLARRSVGDPESDVRPNRTEDLDKLTDSMLRYGYPGFEHNFGLWYDRRRDAHDTAPREDANAVPPFLEQPWAKGEEGRATDGLPLYDLTKFNDWYFGRLREFAALCDRKGTVLFHKHHMQHALLELDAHYVDFPWRPANCIQKTGLPHRVPAANVYYDVSDPVRRDLHRLYIRQCLEATAEYTNVVHMIGQEYTGPLSYAEFWLDTVDEWEKETGHDVLVSLSATKDVVDAILADPRRSALVDIVDLRCFYLGVDGGLVAPRGGEEVPGRSTECGQAQSDGSSPERICQKIRQYRDAYPSKAITDAIGQDRRQTWAVLMAGGSMAVAGQIEYPDHADPPDYVRPANVDMVLPAYDFVRAHLAEALPRMSPADIVLDAPERNWCLRSRGECYLVYALRGGGFRMDLTGDEGDFVAEWLDPRTGDLRPAGRVTAGQVAAFAAPDDQDWALWLHRP